MGQAHLDVCQQLVLPVVCHGPAGGAGEQAAARPPVRRHAGVVLRHQADADARHQVSQRHARVAQRQRASARRGLRGNSSNTTAFDPPTIYLHWGLHGGEAVLARLVCIGQFDGSAPRSRARTVRGVGNACCRGMHVIGPQMSTPLWNVAHAWLVDEGMLVLMLTMEEEPLEPSVSALMRTTQGKVSAAGMTGSSARSARLPWPTSRRPGAAAFFTSLTEKAGKE